MSVIYAPNNNGLGGILGTLATLASATIPGMQWLAPAVAAGTGVSQLARGDTTGGVKSLAGAATGLIKKTPAAATAPKAQGGPDLTDRMQMNKALAQTQQTTPAVQYTTGPDATDRAQIAKALQNQQINNKYNQLVSMYGNSPQTDLTARMQMNKNGGIEDMSRYAALMARYPQLFQGR